MNYEEFSAHFEEAMKEAEEKYKNNLPPIVDPGMDACVEAFIFGDEYISKPLDPTTIEIIRQMLVVQDARQNEDVEEWADKMLEEFEQYPLGDH
jgi:hypothetical protein